MDYERVYNRAIIHWKERGWDKKCLDHYSETHHIVPKSMGGSDDKQNLVVLTAREHLIAHKLLLKIHKNNKMSFALWSMLNSKGGGREGLRLTSREYENLRRSIAILSSINSSLKEPFRHTDKSKRLLSKAHKGKKLSEDTKDRMSKARRGNVCQSKGMYFTPRGSGRSLLELSKLNSCSTTTIQTRCKKDNLK